MDKTDAIAIMHQLSCKLKNVVALEDLVSPYAEFLVHMQPKVSEEDFAFLGTIGAMIYLEGSDKYKSILEAEQLLEKVRSTSEVRR
ncbi:hypothetical protein Q8A64_02765 [Oxalobacteraceae bacterium R-40]|uniref:Uncharacterized protein n=1 Tax=Keguizhuia sedimenti TaxID=3064264 RepID=A0ABU1BK01_9BURK|nr:hypothetical protein [Oxalobacteraceae bacterium R-40]